MTQKQEDTNYIIDFLFDMWEYWQDRAINAERLIGDLSNSSKFDFHFKGQNKCRKHIEKLAKKGSHE